VDRADFLRSLGERIRGERARRGISRKLLAKHAGISERYVTQLESGKGNISIVLLRQVATALGIPLGRLVEEEPATFPRSRRIALVGLRGAGKSTLGRRVAEMLEVPFFELDREIERVSGVSLAHLFDLYGQQAYRRYELQALQELLRSEPQFVVATGGSLVAEPVTYELLLRTCFTVWVRTTPEQHMARVIAQGDQRPMAGSSQAMDDLRRILHEREPLYGRADLTVDTTGAPLQQSVVEVLRSLPSLVAQ
jgi:XRE family transcriptional regulator, aerobic/anaerobic benzoate catabolism transcriptional regulator